MFFLGASNFIEAQQVTGTVSDDSSQPLPGVSIIIKGTSTGTTSDFDGNFSISASDGDVLVFSYVGFDSQEITVAGSTVNVTMQAGVALDEIVLIGSRAPARAAIDSAVPVDVIDVKELATAGPQVNLNQILNYAAPSFTSNTQTISDGTDHIDPASLRGLGPDQVLVLINGKRRHTTSLVNVNGTFGRGSVGTDLNSIPAAAIKRVEVLRDGAAAQYGSDAIAGVINIMLDDSVDELTLNVTNGANFSRNANEQTGGIDGETVNVSANYGVSLGENGGYINFTGDFDYRNHYNRMKEWEGSIFNAYNSVEWVAFHSGGDLTDMSLSDIQFYAQGVTHFDFALKNDINNASSISDLQTLLNFDTTENELAVRSQDRTDYNMRVGTSDLRGGRFFANMMLPIGDNGTELYANTGLSYRKGQSAGFYRLPSQQRAYTPTYINGFLPEINSEINDKSITAGIKGKVGDWDADFSHTYGTNSFDFNITNTHNATLEAESKTSFNAGGFSFTQNTTNVDFYKRYDEIFNGLSVAFGGEFRKENYTINAGEEASYTTYGANHLPVSVDNPIITQDFFGRTRPGGAQVFPGFRPSNALSQNRSSIAGYLDLEADFTDAFYVSGALRYENYSDFGSTLNFKVATRYKLSDQFNLRAAVNTGFRAPSLQQQFFNSTSTVFVDGLPNEVATFRNDSQLAQVLGIPALKEEQSASASVGFTANLTDANLKITVDGYFVAIEDRVSYTGRFSPTPETQAFFDGQNATAAAFFANAIDTESKGLDIVVTHKADLGSKLHLRSDLSGTFSNTRQVDDIHSSSQLLSQESTYFDETSRIYLEEGVPRTKVNFSQTLTSEKFTVFFRNVYFGEVTEATNNLANMQEFGGKLVTDLSVGFKATKNVTLTVGANNLFDIYPDRAIQANRSSGRFDWSRRSQQFGVAGRFLFARLSLNLK